MPSDLVFLTGATGFIGSHVARELVGAGYRVRALDHGGRGPARLPGLDITWIQGDVCRSGDLIFALGGCRYLIHCAALSSSAPHDRARLLKVNVAGTASLLEAARIAGVERAVVTSSAATVGPARAHASATEADVAPSHDGVGYRRSKLEQERAALAARVPVVLLLPTAPVGPGDYKPTPTGRLILDYAHGRTFGRLQSGGLNLVPVEDVARAHVSALQMGNAKERYIVGGENLSFDQVWELLAQVSGRRIRSLRVPHWLALGFAGLDEARCRLLPRATPAIPIDGVTMSRERMFVDSGKAVRELGYSAGPVREAVSRALAWYRANGYCA